MLTVYLSNKYIRIVTGESSSGKVNIRGMYYTIDTTGCLVNGSIVDEEALLDILKEQWEMQNLPKRMCIWCWTAASSIPKLFRFR